MFSVLHLVFYLWFYRPNQSLPLASYTCIKQLLSAQKYFDSFKNFKIKCERTY